MIRRRILITGASAGLGAGMARAFAAKGRDLALCARRVDRLEQLKEELARDCPSVRVAIAPLDVNDHEEVPTVFAELAEQLGGIDRVVINAGIGEGAVMGSGGLQANKAVIETNLVAALVQIETALGMLQVAGSGHLVLITSVAGAKGIPGTWAAYCASKAGLHTLGESLRAEHAAGPLKVSVIQAGYIESEMTANLKRPIFMADNESGAKALTQAIEREPGRAVVPWWPWAPMMQVLRMVPASRMKPAS